MIGTAQEIISWLFEQDREKLFEVKERKCKRSLTQNAYYWSLLNQLARKLKMPDTEVHRNMLRDYGVANVFSAREDVPLQSYFKYYDVIGQGELQGKTYNHVKVYKGSSRMDSTEFSHLLDGMRQECEAQGIVVLTPEETARMEYVSAI